MIRFLALASLVFALSFASAGDEGVGIDPWGRLTTDDGAGLDPHGGGAMDPNGESDIGPGIDPNGARACYSACVDPNGGAVANAGSAMDPNGVRVCYSGCIDPNG